MASPGSDVPRDVRGRLAVALAYERGQSEAPIVSARGEGYMAEQILALARKHGVEVREDKDLVTLLSTLEIGEVIPVEAYAAVAEILSYLYRTNAALKAKREGT